MASRAQARAIRVAVGYAVLAALWILFSDVLVGELSRSKEVVSRLSVYKGWAFVLATAWLLYLERHRSEVSLEEEREALASSERRRRAMVEALPDMVFVLDAQGVVTDYWAPQSATLYSRPEQFIGKPISATVPADLAEAWMERVETTTRTGELTDCRYAMDLPNGRRQFEARIVPCGDGGTVAVVRDITLQHDLIAELGRADRNEVLGRMAGDIAHEFNNVLSAVLGYAEFLSSSLPPGDEVCRGDVEQIMVAARRGAELTSQLLAFSRRQAVHPTTFDPVGLVQELGTVVRRLLPGSVQARYELAASDELRVNADQGLLQHAYLGLLVNARDAMPDGGVATITLGASDDGIRLAVADTGQRLEEASWPHVYEPFWLRNQTGRGSGLGLATIQAVAEQSGGQVGVGRSAEGGNEFWIWLPAAAEHEPVGAEPAPTPVAVPAEGALLLVAEDEPAIRSLAERVLVRAGFRVQLAADGAQALAMVERDGLRPDGVVTDVLMPELGGIDLARALRERLPDLKVLFMSGYTQGHIDLGSDKPADLLVKPFASKELVARVQAMLAG